MDNVVVNKRSSPLFQGSIMVKGSQPTDDGNLLLLPGEKNALLCEYPEAANFVRRFYGSQEFIKGIERWCLWITDEALPLALSIPPVKARIDAVRSFRLTSTKKATVEMSTVPHKFSENRTRDLEALIVPSVSSEKRLYLPAGIVSNRSIISNLAFAVYGAPEYLLSILSSRLHALWTAAVGGQLETRLRYSNTLVYNTFPIPDLSADQKAILEGHAVEILGAREAHPGKTIAWLYDPETMPANLLQAHKDLDDALERMYIGRPLKNDTERLEHLFKLYANMIKKEQAAKAAKIQT